MPVELMREIANKPLPLIITNPDDIDKLRVLAAAGLVIAKLPEGNEPQARAAVLSITSKGQDSIELAWINRI